MSPLHQLALTLLPGIGPVHARILLEHYGNEEAVFNESEKDLIQIPGIGTRLARSFKPAFRKDALRRAEAELKYMERLGVQRLFYYDNKYPDRLKQCFDAPLVLFHQGNAELDHPRVLSIVGSRHATRYGKRVCESLIEQLAPYRPLIVSGLAYGIDVTAHQAALKFGLPTVAVLGHGLNHMYPAAHAGVSRSIRAQGGLLSEFMHDCPPAPGNFPKRNRIIAGLSDATVVVEATEKGGALITAKIASGYDREVFALPGRLSDENAAGCLTLIKNQQAQLITAATDVAHHLNWQEVFKKGNHPAVPAIKNENERKILRIIQQVDHISLEELSNRAGIPRNTLISSLLNLEIAGYIENIPGYGYKYSKTG